MHEYKVVLAKEPCNFNLRRDSLGPSHWVHYHAVAVAHNLMASFRLPKYNIVVIL
jgi:hypothetical protein